MMMRQRNDKAHLAVDKDRPAPAVLWMVGARALLESPIRRPFPAALLVS
jgi:hypothetical protein